MPSNRQRFIDELQKRLDILSSNPERDNEATRHDQIIYPFITSEFGLGWHPSDLKSQTTIRLPQEISESHILRDAKISAKRPDILIAPISLPLSVAVIEEKKRQLSLEQLDHYRLQLTEYQALFECCWGLLTDGEHWILKRNLQTYHKFGSLSELQKHIRDIQHCLAKESVFERFKAHGTIDIVHIVPMGLIIPDVVDPRITCYLKTYDGWSEGVRAVMRKYGIPFTEKDISQNPAFRWEMEQISGQPISPTVVINDMCLPDISGEEVETWMAENLLIIRRK